jgi:hypothetical protein
MRYLCKEDEEKHPDTVICGFFAALLQESE